MNRLATSWRTRGPQETLGIAKIIAGRAGISRVTDATRLDKVGCFVFASIRPQAQSLCVNAGKGLERIDAEVGAYMEAIEYAYAESPRPARRTLRLTVRQWQDRSSHALAVFDFCPIFGRKVSDDEVIELMECDELLSGQQGLLPAELIVHPLKAAVGEPIFGTSTNGLASGNSISEATLHALFELLERDVVSFSKAARPKLLLNGSAMPSPVALLRGQIENAGLRLAVHYLPSEFGLPCFEAHVIDDDLSFPTIAHGSGLHIDPEIALTRAVTEALQSRLSHIHGGRDDLMTRLQPHASPYASRRLDAIESLSASLLDGKAERIAFDAIPCPRVAPSCDAGLDFVMKLLNRRGFPCIFRAILSPPDCPIAVVKVVVPRLEHVRRKLRRLGPRLAAHLLDC